MALPEGGMSVLKAVAQSAPWSQGHGGTATNFTRNEAQRWARQILTSVTYRTKLESELLNRTIDPATERMLWHYAFGKPVENIALTVAPGVEDLSQLSIEELQSRAQALNEQLAEAIAVSEAIDIEKGLLP